MGTFVRHGPCPHCGSKDNRGTYNDGSTWCFGCHTYTPPTGRPVEVKEKPVVDITDTLVTKIPEENLRWLRRYLTDEQIEEFFLYSPSMQRHVYAERNVDDSIFWEARIVGQEDRPKTISSGRKPYSLKGKWKETNTVVIVEDIISAIKLMDLVGVICLHGAVIPMHLFDKLGKIQAIKQVLIWMDVDMLSAASTYQRKFEIWNKPCSVIHTEKDPKDYTYEEITEILKTAVS